MPPSAFAVLLRQSKFASFDPAIAQVYQTHGGDAFRGNWGLKRPLALRRRTAMITVSSVDSRYQQTEWESGEGKARLVKKLEELDTDFELGERETTTSWVQVQARFAEQWLVDSEFAP